jgi:hypothetical protein
MKNVAPAVSPRSEKRERFQKIIAVAINPGAYEDEAIAALRRARALVQENFSLAFPEPTPPKPSADEDGSFQTHISNITALVLPVLMTNLSAQAYGLGLKSKIEVEFIAGRTTYALDVRCDGNASACQVFEEYVSWSIDFYNSHTNS